MSENNERVLIEYVKRALVCQGGHKLTISVTLNNLDVVDVTTFCADTGVFAECPHCQELADMGSSYANAIAIVSAHFR